MILLLWSVVSFHCQTPNLRTSSSSQPPSPSSLQPTVAAAAAAAEKRTSLVLRENQTDSPANRTRNARKERRFRSATHCPTHTQWWSRIRNVRLHTHTHMYIRMYVQRKTRETGSRVSGVEIKIRRVLCFRLLLSSDTVPKSNRPPPPHFYHARAPFEQKTL